MNLEELERIEAALINDEITYEEAGEKIYSTSTKPWQTAYWKKKRSEIIKDACEQCNSSKPPMVLQHTWHPSTYKERTREYYTACFEEAQAKDFQITIEDEEIYLYLNQFTEIKPACPACEMRSFRERKTMKPTFHCNRCHHEFEEPIMVPYHSLLGVAPHFEQVKASMRSKRMREHIWETHGPEIKKRAILKGIEEHKRYMSLEDTRTFCKRCAFLWDRKGKKVCEVCKDTLIPLSMHACYKCQAEGHPGIKIK